MNIKGRARGGPLSLARHLQKDENEVVRVVGIDGVLADDIDGALMQMDALGAGLRTSKTLYHGIISPAPGKDFAMSAADWEVTRNAYLDGMGFAGQPYIEVEHEKIGKDGVLRRHRHIVTATADAAAGYARAIHTGHNYRKHEEIARYLERQLGHDHVQGAHVDRDGKPRPPRTPTHAQHQQAERGAVSPKDAKALGAELWKATDSGKALNGALEARGWLLARGDKPRADGGAYFMAIDPGGEAHELRRMMAVKAADLYARMAEIDVRTLPSVKAAKAFQRERQAQNEPREVAGVKHGGAVPAAAPQADDSRKRKMAIEREDATDPKTIQRQIDDQQGFAAQAKEQTELSERFLAGLQRDHEEGEKLKEAELRAAQKAALDDDITDARRRYLQAAEHFDIRRPYASLSEIAGIEGATFQREQERLRREAAQERDPDKRELIDLRRQIEANDYMAITSHRLSEMSKVITGNSNSDESQRQAERAEYFAAEALELRRQRQELQEQINEREAQREADRLQQGVENPRPYRSRDGASDADLAREHARDGRGGSSSPAPVTGQDNARDTPREAAPAPEAAPASSLPRTTEGERPAEVIHSEPTAPERETAPQTRPERENTDARQSNSAENAEITDSKAAKKAALAQMRAETEQSIEQGAGRGFGHSR